MKNQLMTKSSDCKSDLVKGHASRPYSSTGKHLTLINRRVTSSEATRPILAKNCIRCMIKWLFAMFQRAPKRAWAYNKHSNRTIEQI